MLWKRLSAPTSMRREARPVGTSPPRLLHESLIIKNAHMLSSSRSAHNIHPTNTTPTSEHQEMDSLSFAFNGKKLEMTQVPKACVPGGRQSPGRSVWPQQATGRAGGPCFVHQPCWTSNLYCWAPCQQKAKQMNLSLDPTPQREAKPQNHFLWHRVLLRALGQ